MNFKLFAVLMLSSFIAGCGIKGPLYMPPEDDSAVVADEEPVAQVAPSNETATTDADAQESANVSANDEALSDADKVSSALNSTNVGDKASATTR